jgi:hypothetical protein
MMLTLRMSQRNFLTPVLRTTSLDATSVATVATHGCLTPNEFAAQRVSAAPTMQRDGALRYMGAPRPVNRKPSEPHLGIEPDLSAGRHTDWAGDGWHGAGISINCAQDGSISPQPPAQIIGKHVRDTGQRSDLAESL